MSSNEPVRVEQCDRELALNLLTESSKHASAMAVRDGIIDDHPLLQRLARHRTLSQADGRREVERISDVLDTERYRVALALQGIKRAIDGRRWLSEPGRGSYTYDDERYQAEFGGALDEIDEALKPLRSIARDWSDCPRDPLRVAANRTAALTEVHQEKSDG